MSTPRAFGNGIIFQFCEKVVKSKKSTFEESTDWGFELGNSFDESAKRARWGVVTSIGPEVKSGITVGTKVYIEALQWSSSFTIDEVTYWKTDEDRILAAEA